MRDLYDYQELLFENLSQNKRYLYEEIDYSNRLIGIKGARGSGKTTLLLQRTKQLIDGGKIALYATLDHIYFLENTILDLAKVFNLEGGSYLFLDEVHKYPRWSRELKLLYDMYPKLSVIFTSSSILEIYRGESDLSRRALTYHLKELSFREYLEFEGKGNLSKYTLKDILEKHVEIGREIKKTIGTPVKFFKEYLKAGAYPYYWENRKSYPDRLIQTINLIIETDLNVVENIAYSDSRKIKKLLIAIAQSVPFTPNVKKLSERLGLSRNFLVNAIKLLDRADLIMELYTPKKGIGALTKPEKIYLQNTNLIYALGNTNAEIGAVRETFFANQMRYLHTVHLAEKGDFLIDEKYTFEVGGSNKTNKQISGMSDAYVVRDNLEVGGMNIIPLYLFGFMY